MHASLISLCWVAVAEPRAISRLWRRRRPTAWVPKNVTILGLPRLAAGLHIVCPKDSQRYYLLFTRIHRLFALLLTTIRILLKTSTPPSPR